MAADLPPREAMDFDVVIVGAGPAGLSAAIRLKQLAATAGQELSVVVLEKGSEVGAHILSGAVIDPIGLATLIPDWKAKGAPVETRGQRGPLLLSGARGRPAHPEFRHAAADEQSRQLHRQPRQSLPLARRAGGGDGRGDLSGLRRRRGALRREGRGGGRRHRRHGGRQGRQADRPLHPRHGAQGQVHDHRRGSAGLAVEGADGQVRPRRRVASRRSTASGSRSCGRCGPRRTSPAWCSTRSAGRSTTAPAAARSSITTAATWCRSASSSTSTTRTPISRPTASSSASRPIPSSATPSRAASASPTARGRSPRAAGNRSPSWRFPAACWSAARPGS